MGVYINGMEMPTSCEDCPFYVEADEMLETNDWCYVLNRPLGRGTEKDIDGYDCPIIPVPPHGRLIDADALAEEHRIKAYKNNGSSYHFHITAKAWIDNAPTIIEAEEGEK